MLAGVDEPVVKRAARGRALAQRADDRRDPS
jgi:hypothetical protein